MPEAARLVLVADASYLKRGEQALDSIARKGGQVEGRLTISAKCIEVVLTVARRDYD